MIRATDTFEQQQRPAVLSLVVGLIVLASIYAHFRLAGLETYTGLFAPLDRIFDLTLALTISIVATAVGMRISQLLRLNFSGAAETISISFFLGTGVVGLAILGLGLLGLLKPLPVLLVFVVALILSRFELVRLYRLVSETLSRLAANKPLFALFAALALLLLLRTVTPPYVFDEAIYHLPVSRQFVDAGRVFPLFNNSMGNQPFLIHMIYAVCLMAGSDIAAKFFSLALAVATAFALYGFCQRFLTRNTGVIAIFTFFAAGMVVEVAVTTRVDVSVAGILFVTAYAMINYLETGARGWLWTSALLAGFSLGVKHSAALSLLLVGVMYLIESLRRHRKIFDTLKYGIAYAAIAFAVASPWYLKNYAWFGNPVYPFFTGEVASFGPQGMRYFNSEDERKLDAHFDQVRKEDPQLVRAQEQELVRRATTRPARHPMLPWEIYLKPNTYLMAEARHYPNYLFLVVPFFFLFKKPQWLIWLFALSAAYFLMATWSTWIARYLLPIYPALTIVTAYTLVAAGERLKIEKLPVYLVALALIVVGTSSLKTLMETNAFSFIAGTSSRRDFRHGFTHYRPIDFINANLPADASLMMVGAQMVYGIQREYLADETWYTTKWRRLLIHTDSLEQVHEELKRQGVDYILFSPDLYLFAASMGLENGQVVPPAPRGLKTDNELKRSFPEAQRLGTDFPVLRNFATFSVYRKKFLEPVYSDENGYRIFRLR